MALAFFGPLVLFWLMAVTEQEPLSPRVRTLVPKKPWLAFLSIPFLPGGGRGLWFALLVLVMVSLGALFTPLLHGIPPCVDHWMMRVLIMATCYGMFYAGVGRLLARVIRRGILGSWLARIATILVFVLGLALPLFVDVFVQGRVHNWGPHHILNPFWTIDRHTRVSNLWNVLPVLIGLALLGVFLNLPAMLRGAREVMAASRERRELHAPTT
jgi:hypothetical protein